MCCDFLDTGRLDTRRCMVVSWAQWKAKDRVVSVRFWVLMYKCLLWGTKHVDIILTRAKCLFGTGMWPHADQRRAAYLSLRFQYACVFLVAHTGVTQWALVQNDSCIFFVYFFLLCWYRWRKGGGNRHPQPGLFLMNTRTNNT